MSQTTIERKLSDRSRGVLLRADGSVRQAHIQESGGGIVDAAFYTPGSQLGPDDDSLEPVAGRRCWHWASTLTDDELARHLHYTPERIAALRELAAEADAARRFTEFEGRA